MSDRYVVLQATFRNFFTAAHIALIKDRAIKRAMFRAHKEGDIFSLFAEYVEEATDVKLDREATKKVFYCVAFSRRPSRFTEFFGTEEATVAFLDWYLETFDIPENEAFFQAGALLPLRKSFYSHIISSFGDQCQIYSISFDDFDVEITTHNKIDPMNKHLSGLKTSITSWLRSNGLIGMAPLSLYSVKETNDG